MKAYPHTGVIFPLLWSLYRSRNGINWTLFLSSLKLQCLNISKSSSRKSITFNKWTYNLVKPTGLSDLRRTFWLDNSKLSEWFYRAISRSIGADDSSTHNIIALFSTRLEVRRCPKRTKTKIKNFANCLAPLWSYAKLFISTTDRSHGDASKHRFAGKPRSQCERVYRSCGEKFSWKPIPRPSYFWSFLLNHCF